MSFFFFASSQESGAIVNGNASLFVQANLQINAHGIFSETSLGGVVIGNSAIVNVIYFAPASVGILANSTASANVIYSISSIGSLICAGQAQTYVEYNLFSTTAVVIGGEADWLKTTTEVGNGTVLANSTALANAIYSISSIGSLICAGQAQTYVEYNLFSTTAVVIGGQADWLKTSTEVGNGTVLANSTASANVIYSVSSIGSLVCGGQAQVVVEYDLFSVTAVVIGGQADWLKTSTEVGHAGAELNSAAKVSVGSIRRKSRIIVDFFTIDRIYFQNNVFDPNIEITEGIKNVQVKKFEYYSPKVVLVNVPPIVLNPIIGVAPITRIEHYSVVAKQKYVQLLLAPVSINQFGIKSITSKERFSQPKIEKNSINNPASIASPNRGLFKITKKEKIR